MKTARQQSWLAYLAPSVFALMVAVFYGVHDYWLDDWEFGRFLGLNADGSFTLPGMSDLRALLAERWRTDSFRLCNAAVPPMLLLPRWLTAALMGAMWYGFIMITLRLVHIRSWRAAWCAVGLMAVVPPWWAYLPTLSSNLNYVASLLIAAGVLWLFFQPVRMAVIVAFGIGAFAGWWHEALSAPLIAAFIVVMVLNPAFRTRRNVWLTVGLVFGFLLLNVNPGLLYRMNMAAGTAGLYSDGAPRWINLAINCVLPVAFVVISFVRCRDMLRSPLWQALTVVMAVSLAIEAVTGIVRSSFLSQYISCVAIVWIIAEGWPERFAKSKTVAAIVSLFVVIVTFGAACYDGVKVNRANRAFINAVRTMPGGVVSVPILMPGEGCWAAVGKAPAMIYQLPAFHFLYGLDFNNVLGTKIIPEVFSTFSPSDSVWQETPAGNYRRGHALVMPYNGAETDRWRRVGAEVTFPVIGQVPMVVNVLPFKAADGKVYQAVVLNEQPPYMPAPADIIITRPRGVFSFW